MQKSPKNHTKSPKICPETPKTCTKLPKSGPKPGEIPGIIEEKNGKKIGKNASLKIVKYTKKKLSFAFRKKSKTKKSPKSNMGGPKMCTIKGENGHKIGDIPGISGGKKKVPKSLEQHPKSTLLPQFQKIL